VHGLVDELYIAELAMKTFRGVEQCALKGLHTGGRVFGYLRVPESTTETESHGRPVIKGVRLEVDPNQAATIRRIFERYATGDSMKRIAMDLNGEGIASPQPRKGRSQSWCPSSIHHILHNERYRGMVIWGKTFKLRSQETRKRIYKRKAESEWCRTDVPGQRIVSDKLWNAVRERMKTVGQVYGGEGKNRPRSGRAAGSPYLFTGLLQCSECGGSITIVSGKWNGRQDHRYGCSLHWYRGGKICTNNLLIYRKTLETQLLGGLEQRVLNPEVIEYTLQSLEKQLMRGINRQGGQSAQYQTRVDIIQKQIRNCTDAICAGKSYPSLMERLSELEQDLADAKAKLANAEPRTIRIQLRDTRRFVEM
jgi:site-specific DNA recombinase